MQRAFFMGFALVAYAIFFATFLYLIAFVGNLPWVPLTVDRGPEAPLGDGAGHRPRADRPVRLQHSVMARQGFKRAWTRIVPKPVERSVYVLLASAALIILFALLAADRRDVWDVTQSRWREPSSGRCSRSAG